MSRLAASAWRSFTAAVRWPIRRRRCGAKTPQWAWEATATGPTEAEPAAGDLAGAPPAAAPRTEAADPRQPAAGRGQCLRRRCSSKTSQQAWEAASTTSSTPGLGLVGPGETPPAEAAQAEAARAPPAVAPREDAPGPRPHAAGQSLWRRRRCSQKTTQRAWEAASATSLASATEPAVPPAAPPAEPAREEAGGPPEAWQGRVGPPLRALPRAVPKAALTLAERGIAVSAAMQQRVAQREAAAAEGSRGREAMAAGREQLQVEHGQSSSKGLLAYCARCGSYAWRAHKLLARECEGETAGLRTQRNLLRRRRFPHYSQPWRLGPPRELEGRELRRLWEAAGRPELGLGEPGAAAPAQTGQETPEPPDRAALLSCFGVGDEGDFKRWAAAERQRRRRRQRALDGDDDEDFYFGHEELLDEGDED